jgi:AmmeMemoRadiSam system protein B
MSAPRPPAVAGAFYPSDPAELARLVEACFLDASRGPGTLPPRHRPTGRRLRALVVPHAGLVYSGAIAAWAYLRAAMERPFPTVLILGVDHHGRGGFALSRRPWATPWGPTKVDEEMVDRLDRPPISIDEEAHSLEHSIEVQLPFLEYVEPAPKIVALQVPYRPLRELLDVGRTLEEAIGERDLLLIASTDFSHYVTPEVALQEDRRAIDAILRHDAEGLYNVVEQRGISMCGVAPTTVLLAALSAAHGPATLLHYGHSGEVAPMDRVVGYAAIAIERPSPMERPTVK